MVLELERRGRIRRVPRQPRSIELTVLAGEIPALKPQPIKTPVAAIGNLLQNSSKFTPRGGSAAISLHEDERFGVVVVRDTGPGVAAEMLPRLFKPFVQAENTLARSDGGLGLGLALAKGLVELHGGSISAQSEGSGKGTTFVLRFPLDEAPRLISSQRRQRGRPSER